MNKLNKRGIIWLVWLTVSGALISYYAFALSVPGKKMVYLPGQSSHGHKYIEEKCELCHTESFRGKEALQKACVNCHLSELKRVEDSHPKSKFTDPRNADRVKQLDARYCVTCHREHKPEITDAMGVTLPKDFCYFCHQDIAEDRASHKNMGFDTCANAGCHNFHDNKALYEDFLVKHGQDPDLLNEFVIIERNLRYFLERLNAHSPESIPVDLLDAPLRYQDKQSIEEWRHSAHAKGGVNCGACHNPVDIKINPAKSWIEKPDSRICGSCHTSETMAFLESKHGMSIKAGLGPLRVRNADLAMNQSKQDHKLECNTCHGSHSYNLTYSRIDACLQCHEDKHSVAFKDSPHYRQTRETDHAVTCATCHLPRLRVKEMGIERTLVQHNQNATLRPNEKMIRPVCMNCHGLNLAINALADAELVRGNFSGAPSIRNASIEMALAREAEKSNEKHALQAQKD